MVTKKELIARIEKLEEEKELLFNAIKALNKKVNKHIKGEQADNQESNKIDDWLTDDRVDEIQHFLHKGVK